MRAFFLIYFLNTSSLTKFILLFSVFYFCFFHHNNSTCVRACSMEKIQSCPYLQTKGDSMHPLLRCVQRVRSATFVATNQNLGHPTWVSLFFSNLILATLESVLNNLVIQIHQAMIFLLVCQEFERFGTAARFHCLLATGIGG